MRVAMSLLLGVIVLSGCTRVLDISGVEWRRANTAIQEETWDEVECARSTEYAGDLPDTIIGGIADMIVVPLDDSRRAAAFDRCMVGKGYQRVAAQTR